VNPGGPGFVGFVGASQRVGQQAQGHLGGPYAASQATAAGNVGHATHSSLPGSQSVLAMQTRSQAGLSEGVDSLDSPDQEDSLLYATPLNGFREDWREDHSWMMQNPSQAHV